MSSEFEHNLDWSSSEDFEQVVHRVDDELAVVLHAPNVAPREADTGVNAVGMRYAE